MTLAAGSRLGPYEILAAIGAGGMGEVYRARDTRLERTVAVKVLPEHLTSNEELRQRFEREAKTISQLSHPHICALYDVGREGDARLPRHGVPRGRDARRAAGQGRAALRAAPALRHRDRRRAGQGAPAGNRAPGLEARQRHADEVGRQAPRLRPREVPDGRARQHDFRGLGPGDAGPAEPAADGARHGPRDVPVHGAGAARRRRGRRALGHLRVRRRALRDGDGKEGVRRQEPGESRRVDPARRPDVRSPRSRR